MPSMPLGASGRERGSSRSLSRHARLNSAPALLGPVRENVWNKSPEYSTEHRAGKFVEYCRNTEDIAERSRRRHGVG